MVAELGKKNKKKYKIFVENVMELLHFATLVPILQNRPTIAVYIIRNRRSILDWIYPFSDRVIWRAQVI